MNTKTSHFSFQTKLKISLILCVISFSLAAQNGKYNRWVEMAQNDISLRPEYGNVEKNDAQKKSDATFKEKILEFYKNDTIAASKKMSDLGFKYLYDKGDLVSAMRRFNQAYILNSKNDQAYYGFGSVYFNLGAMNEAREQYDKGLKLNPENSAILTDYGTTYLGDYYNAISNNSDSNKLLELANDYLLRSYQINKEDSNTMYKLSIVKMYLGDCKAAKAFLKQAQKMKNPNITEAFISELNQKCQ
ncbi:tetratricopeptide repeat protein [uncultured Psychroserpens sp.]|uniref:tetratricopeptide repeat protein n=1 Tax=uncultured Psychroserpens sp. TaxID=255436 RepID=UPI0026369D38|nr:tetratricopeptide repeat protein [uncultured Psychroserpens sp.]